MSTSETLPALYGELAGWWSLLSPPEHYVDEAHHYHQILHEATPIPPCTVLELGSGGGSNAFHLKKNYQMTLVDLSPDMLAISRALNPECEHLQGDMRTVRLGRQFDAVFVHDAVMYMISLDDLRQAMETAYIHCKPGGSALFAPDCVKETFRPNTDHGGHDREGRSMRYLEWNWDPDPTDTTFVADFAYLLRQPDGTMRCEHDRHTLGLFPRADWLRLLEETGFQPRVIPFEHSEVEPGMTEIFIGVKSTS